MLHNRTIDLIVKIIVFDKKIKVYFDADISAMETCLKTSLNML